MNLYVNAKNAFNSEEGISAALWMPEVQQMILNGKKGEEEEKGSAPLTPPSLHRGLGDSTFPPTLNLKKKGRRTYVVLVSYVVLCLEEQRQLLKDQENLPLKMKSKTSTELFPLREVQSAQGGLIYVSAPLSAAEVRNSKKEIKDLMADPQGLSEQLDQFWGPNKYILGVN